MKPSNSASAFSAFAETVAYWHGLTAYNQQTRKLIELGTTIIADGNYFRAKLLYALGERPAALATEDATDELLIEWARAVVEERDALKQRIAELEAGETP